jgi:flagellar basal body L-ring protein FlgH
MVRKIILFALTLLVFAGCDVAMDQLDVTNGTKYIVTSKKEKTGDYYYTYHLIKEGDRFYDYLYIDTVAFNVGDTLVVNISKK